MSDEKEIELVCFLLPKATTQRAKWRKSLPHWGSLGVEVQDSPSLIGRREDCHVSTFIFQNILSSGTITFSLKIQWVAEKHLGSKVLRASHV